MPRRGGWFPVYPAAMKGGRKFEPLTLEERGAWLMLRGEVELLGDGPISRRAALAVLAACGVAGRRAEGLLDRLTAVGLLDVVEGDWLAIHDLEDNRPGGYPSDAPEATRERKRKSRDVATGHEQDVTSVTTDESRDGTLARVDKTRRDETKQDGGSARALDDEPEGPALTWLAQHGCYVKPANGYHRQLVTAVERHGIITMLDMFTRLSRAGVKDGDIKGFLFGAIDALNGKPDLRVLETEDREAEAEQSWDRRVQATREQTADLRAALKAKEAEQAGVAR